MKQSISKFAIRLGRPSNDKNFLISLNLVSILLGVQIRCTRSISALTQEVLCRHGTKLTKLEYCPVKISIDAKAINSGFDVQKVRSTIFEYVKGKADI